MKHNFVKATGALSVLFIIALTASLAVGQGIVTGSISGVVLDPQGAVVSGAKVTAKQLATNRDYSTDSTAAGIFNLRVLPPGQYDVTVEGKGFRIAQSHNVMVDVGADTSLGVVKLEVGSSTETVTVEGAAPLIETTTDQITNTFEAQQAQTIPLGNNFDTLALFLPGVAPLGDAGFSNLGLSQLIAR